jgi:hypothetical protein
MLACYGTQQFVEIFRRGHTCTIFRKNPKYQEGHSYLRY